MKQISIYVPIDVHQNETNRCHKCQHSYISKLQTVFISDQCFLISNPPKQSKFTYMYVYLYALKYGTLLLERVTIALLLHPIHMNYVHFLINKRCLNQHFGVLCISWADISNCCILYTLNILTGYMYYICDVTAVLKIKPTITPQNLLPSTTKLSSRK